MASKQYKTSTTIPARPLYALGTMIRTCNKTLPLKKLISTLTRKPKDGIFHLFPQLPAELRLQIWTFALQQDTELVQSRNVTIYKFTNTFQIRLSRRYHALFAVNQESRYEAARVLGGEWVVLVKSISKTLQVYINFDFDFVLLRGCNELFVQENEKPTFSGHPVSVWNYSRNLGSSNPMYTIGSGSMASRLLHC
ncbi:hypothetical protein IQ07DRAFT_639086 [Pyrenochaeta sp. DS3sAY3a]|nr:hypothetical protein IQ07DRAFT_639086 [Pyrenochaeta sp. DS3sAY3a]